MIRKKMLKLLNQINNFYIVPTGCPIKNNDTNSH